MKAKLKSPDILKQKGQKTNIQLLKKMMTEGIKEPQKFFYDIEFDFGDEKLPILYIGESVPTPWKKYIKDKKKEKTFAAGSCISDDKGRLKLVAEIGKGAKANILKTINKELLKKCKTKAYFVESIDSEGEVEEPNEIQDDAVVDSLENVDPKVLLAELKEQIAKGESIDQDITPIINTLEAPLSDLKNTIITDDLIDQVDESVNKLNSLNFEGFLLNTKSLLESTKDEQEADEELAKVAKQLDNLLAGIKSKVPSIDNILLNSSKVQKVEDPMESEHPPVSDDPFENFANKMSSFMNSSILDKDLKELAG